MQNSILEYAADQITVEASAVAKALRRFLQKHPHVATGGRASAESRCGRSDSGGVARIGVSKAKFPDAKINSSKMESKIVLQASPRGRGLKYAPLTVLNFCLMRFS
jgi:hypothetical protein